MSQSQGLESSDYRTGLRVEASPAPIRWAENLLNLLSDSDGVELFQQYLTSEGLVEQIDFWFACEGLKKLTDTSKIQKLVKVIYKTYLKNRLVPISEATHNELSQRIGDKCDVHVFDTAQKETEEIMARSTYINFLKSPLYLEYLSSYISSTGSPRKFPPPEGPAKYPSDHSSEGSEDEAEGAGGSPSPPGAGRPSSSLGDVVGAVGGTAASPQKNSSAPTSATNTLPLTRGALLATQERRVIESLDKGNESYLRTLSVNRAQNPYHARYASYTNVSRQDSELQSLSSDARTDDTYSQSGASQCSRDWYPHRMSRSHQKRLQRLMRENANLNRDPFPSNAIIPRTQRMNLKEGEQRLLNPKEFAEVLIYKLTILKQEREAQERVQETFRRMKEESPGMTEKEIHRVHALSSLPPGLLDLALKEKCSRDDPDQSILDAHVSRVWEDSSHPSPAAVVSPLRQPSPPEVRRAKPPISGKPHSSLPRGHRFKPGSRTVRDYIDSGSQIYGVAPAGLPPSHPARSRSIPDSIAKAFLHRGGPMSGPRSGTGPGRPHSPSMPSSSMKPGMSEATLGTDSGVSVVSDTAPVSSKDKSVFKGAFTVGRERSRVLSWMSVSKFGGNSGAADNSRSSSISHKAAQSKGSSPRGSRRGPSSKARSQMGVPGEESASAANGDHVIVGMVFCDEKVPYRFKVPGKKLTLKNFKLYLPKKGNYRFFFKRDDLEFGTGGVIQEEVLDDNQVLPLWEGKVFATVRAVDPS
ncbi:unnamed protein product [Cyprideis torosa]|uniref:Uncharacterized protein n=1 Tax=Cyprideis torosa TaxID=163714 RepID=A0A7R8ZP89_9CRUS|nr:unnamed protein product [Cyprideis torosa]CAG0893404.1 unnamed protein product [Cyprideis torosa]